MGPSFSQILCGFLLSTAALVYGQRVDLTVEPGTIGTDVVWAVLSKIDLAGIFPSDDADLAGIFMRRLAYVETHDGMKISSSNSTGGIWQVNQEILEQTQAFSYTTVSTVYQMIRTQFGFDWRADVTYSNMSQPLISGLAIRIYLDYLEKSVREVVPPQIGQASYWSTYFHVGANITIWEEAIAELNIKEECTVNTDVMVVLDSSGSIGDANYQRVREFTHNFADALFQNSGEDRMGIVLFGSEGVVEKGLDTHMNKKELLQFIDNLPYFSGSTNTADGLCMLLSQPWRREELVLKLAIVLTDGQSNRDSVFCGKIAQAAMQVHSIEPPVLVDAIGVGDQINSTELELIATSPDHVYYLDNYDMELTRTQEEQAFKICRIVSQPLPVGHLSNGSSGQGEKTRLSLSVSIKEDITLRLCVLRGSIVAYASTTIQNPSSALYDWKAEVSVAAFETINCLTNFFAFERQTDTTTSPTTVTTVTPAQNKNENTLYVSVEGVDEHNEFIVNSTTGNVTLDTNECLEDPIPCGADATCHNTDGSYYCVCNEGYRGDGENCTDIDECIELDPCNKNAQCTNTFGGYTCECSDGYTGDGIQCTDTNECLEDPIPCGANATCHNTDGSYYCVCNEGYHGDGENCTDIDECIELDPCDRNAQCTNTFGGYTCVCNDGYTGDGIQCTDLNECEHGSLNRCHKHAQCTNTVGGHHCTCIKGYSGDGLSCSKVRIDVSTYVIIGVGGAGGLVVLLVILIGIALFVRRLRKKKAVRARHECNRDYMQLLKAEDYTDI